MIVIQATHPLAAPAERSPVEDDFGVLGKHPNHVIELALILGLLEGLMELPKGLLLLQQRRTQGGIVYLAMFDFRPA